MLCKGKISSVANDGGMATVTPYNGGIVTPFLVVPQFLNGILFVGDPVVYALFQDNTGIIMARADGVGGNSGSGGEGDGEDGETAISVSASIENNVLVVTAGDNSGVSAYVNDGVLHVTQSGDDITAYVRDGVLVVDTVGSGDGVPFKIDDTLVWSEDGVLSVNTADTVEKDNTRPITSAAVHTTVGNIEVLLSLI